MDAASLYCCSAQHTQDLEELQHLHDSINLMEVFELYHLQEDEIGDLDYLLSLDKISLDDVLKSNQYRELQEWIVAYSKYKLDSREKSTASGDRYIDDDFAECTDADLVKYQEVIDHHEIHNTSLLICPAQPFHMKLSLMGEVFEHK